MSRTTIPTDLNSTAIVSSPFSGDRRFALPNASLGGSLAASSPEALRDAALAGIVLVQLPASVVWREVEARRLMPVLERSSADA